MSPKIINGSIFSDVFLIQQWKCTQAAEPTFGNFKTNLFSRSRMRLPFSQSNLIWSQLFLAPAYIGLHSKTPKYVKLKYAEITRGNVQVCRPVVLVRTVIHHCDICVPLTSNYFELTPKRQCVRVFGCARFTFIAMHSRGRRNSVFRILRNRSLTDPVAMRFASCY